MRVVCATVRLVSSLSDLFKSTPIVGVGARWLSGSNLGEDWGFEFWDIGVAHESPMGTGLRLGGSKVRCAGHTAR